MDRGYTPLAKLARPRLHGPLRRDRLFALLDQGENHPITWVTGPPGCGKTTLVASYVEARRFPVSWYQVDEGDSDPATWFSYLAELAGRATRRKQSSLPYLTPEYLPDVPGFTRRFFRLFFARLPSRGVLVLDNCHDANKPPFNTLLREALEELPARRRVIAISRAEPPSDLARLTASGLLQTIDWNELRLTDDEVQAIAVAAGIADEHSIVASRRICNGWAAGLTLLLTSIRRGGSIATIESIASKEAIFKYFAGELFDRADVETQDLLMRTAMFPQFDVDLATAVSGNLRAASIFEYLYRHHYFTDRRADSKITYRYHDLFREFLLARLTVRYDRATLQTIASQAGSRLIDAGSIEDGFPLLIQGGEFSRAREIILRRAPGLLAEGRSHTLRQWITTIPDPKDAWLLYWLGLSQMPTEPLVAEATLNQAFQEFAAISDTTGQVLSAAAVLESRYFSMANWGDMAPWIESMEHLLVDYQSLSADLQVRAYAALVNAVLFSTPHDRRVEIYLDRAISAIRTTQDMSAKVAATAIVLNSLNLQGRLEDAAALYAEIEHIASSTATPPLARAFLLGHQAFNIYLAGKPTDSLQAIDEALRLVQDHGLMPVAGLLVCYKFIILVTRGRAEEGAPLLEELARQVLPNRVADLAIIDLMRVWVGNGTGASTEEVLRLAEVALQSVEAVEAPWYTLLWSWMLAGPFVDAGCFDKAKSLLDASQCVRHVPHLNCFVASHLLAEAYLVLAKGDEATARVLTIESLKAARLNGGLSYMGWLQPRVLQRMAAFAFRQEIDPEYMARLVERYHVPPPPGAPSDWPWPFRVLTLGRFAVFAGQQPIPLSRKTPQRLFALLKYLASQSGRAVSEDTLAAVLWPETEGHEGTERLKTAIHRLRRFLGDHDVLRVQGRQVWLDPTRIWVDCWALEQYASAPSAVHLASAAEMAGDLLALYKGDFLEGDRDEPWILPARERLRSTMIGTLASVAKLCQSSGNMDQAIALYAKGIEIDSLAESLYRELMLCYESVRQPAEGIAVYRRLERTLSILLSAKPARESRAVFDRLLATTQ